MNSELLKGIANSDYKDNLVAYLKQVQSHLADIRNGTYTNETRLSAVNAIEDLIISKLRVASDLPTLNKDDYK